MDHAANTAPEQRPVDDSGRLDQPADAVPMDTLHQAQADGAQSTDAPATDTAAPAAVDPDNTDAANTITDAPAPTAEPARPEPIHPAPTKTRSDSMAIGPAQDEIKMMAPAGGVDDGPVCQITLLLTTGTRHPYKIDARYLSKRNVPVPDKTDAGQPDPFSISIYTLKELILREWRADWEAKPSSPSSIRLIHFGKLLDDKEPLKTYHFSTEAPNVVHMSIRPQDLDEEDPKSGSKSGGGGGAGSSRRGASNCCIIL